MKNTNVPASGVACVAIFFGVAAGMIWASAILVDVFPVPSMVFAVMAGLIIALAMILAMMMVKDAS